MNWSEAVRLGFYLRLNEGPCNGLKGPELTREKGSDNLLIIEG